MLDEQNKEILNLKKIGIDKTKDVTIFYRILATSQKINNRINHDFVGVIINTKIGHYLGNPLAINLDDDSDGDGAKKLLKFRRYVTFDRVLVN